MLPKLTNHAKYVCEYNNKVLPSVSQCTHLECKSKRFHCKLLLFIRRWGRPAMQNLIKHDAPLWLTGVQQLWCVSMYQCSNLYLPLSSIYFTWLVSSPPYMAPVSTPPWFCSAVLECHLSSLLALKINNIPFDTDPVSEIHCILTMWK